MTGTVYVLQSHLAQVNRTDDLIFLDCFCDSENGLKTTVLQSWLLNWIDELEYNPKDVGWLCQECDFAVSVELRSWEYLRMRLEVLAVYEKPNAIGGFNCQVGISRIDF